MSGTDGVPSVFAASLHNLKISCWLPTLTGQTDSQNACLDQQSAANFNTILNANHGNLKKLIEAQERWRGTEQIRALVEPEKSISEMATAAARPLQHLLKNRPCISINCQSTRGNGYGHATMTRVLKEIGTAGQGHTTSHRGTTNFYAALEQAIVLAAFEKADGILISAVDRWLGANPRVLGKWAVFSDGAALAYAEVTSAVPANCWVLNANISPCNVWNTYEIGCCPEAVRHEISTHLQCLTACLSGQDDIELTILPPCIGQGFTEAVDGHLCSTSDLKAQSAGRPDYHFCSADALFRLASAAKAMFKTPGQIRRRAFLVWDFEPQGLLGAAIIMQDALVPQSQDQAA